MDPSTIATEGESLGWSLFYLSFAGSVYCAFEKLFCLNSPERISRGGSQEGREGGGEGDGDGGGISGGGAAEFGGVKEDQEVVGNFVHSPVTSTTIVSINLFGQQTTAGQERIFKANCTICMSS